MIKAVLFDIDGVLLDSSLANRKFYNAVLGHGGFSLISLERYRDVHMLPLRDGLSLCTGLTGVKLDKLLEAAKLIGGDFEKYLVMPKRADKVVKSLKKKYRLGLVSSRLNVFLYEGWLREYRDYFDVAIGYDDSQNHKPHPEPLLLAAKRLGILPSECVYIGDASTDREAALAAGMHFLYFTPIKSDDALVVNSFDEILEKIVFLGR